MGSVDGGEPHAWSPGEVHSAAKGPAADLQGGTEAAAESAQSLRWQQRWARPCTSPHPCRWLPWADSELEQLVAELHSFGKA
ncbi:Hypothetical predicted protein [Lynx pardinus]|uniref:Uncharacterized protein n=1 Tax=Lynx pardinus TaxID=191816 RepID=A0A485MB56_LYNPA|nr:Hypothetical predicted protein [Lynx pardinus]